MGKRTVAKFGTQRRAHRLPTRRFLATHGHPAREKYAGRPVGQRSSTVEGMEVNCKVYKKFASIRRIDCLGCY